MRDSQGPRTLRFKTILPALVCAASTLPGCAPPQGRIDLLRQVQESGQDVPAPALASGVRLRQQHSSGGLGENLFPILSPSGKEVYYSSSRHSERLSIVRKTLGTAPVTEFTSGPGHDIHPAPSPDGRRLAFSSNREGTWSLYLLEASGEKPLRRISDGGEDCFAPSWAPDSRRIVHFRRGARSGGWEVWILDAEAGTSTYLRNGLFPVWSPAGEDGEWIAFQTASGQGEGWYTIWKMRPDGSQPTQLTFNEAWGAVHPTWSPNGAWLAFASVGKSPEARGVIPGMAVRADDIYLMTAAGTQVTNVTGDRAGISEWNPSFGSDGRIYFNSDEGGGVNVWSIDPGVGPGVSR